VVKSLGPLADSARGRALIARQLADFLVAALLHRAARQRVGRFEQEAGHFRNAQPGYAREQAPAHGNRRERKQGRTGPAKQVAREPAQFDADDPTRSLRQILAVAVHAQEFQGRARSEEQPKPGQGKQQRPRFDFPGVLDPPVAANYAVKAQHHPPVRRPAEQHEHEVRYQRPGAAASILHHRSSGAARKPGIGLMVREQDQQQVAGGSHQRQPLRLAQQSGEFRRERCNTPGFLCRSHGYAYSQRLNPAA